MEKKKPPSEEAEKIRYRSMSSSWIFEDVPLDTYGSFVSGWDQFHNRKRGRVNNMQFKFNHHPGK